MLNTIYRLTEPRKIETEFNDLPVNDDQVIVRPTHLSICNADQRYYQGTRDPEMLAKKLPITACCMKVYCKISIISLLLVSRFSVRPQ